MATNQSDKTTKPVSQDNVISLFIDLVEKGAYVDHNLEPKHIYRGYSVQHISDSIFHITIERHPHLFGRPSLGRRSSAFATVEQVYKLDVDTKEIDFVDEYVIDIKIDYYALAEEDLSSDLGDWWITEKEEKMLAKCKSKEEATKFAEVLLEKIGLNILLDELYISQYKLPDDFTSRLIKAHKEIFLEKVLEKWKYDTKLDI